MTTRIEAERALIRARQLDGENVVLGVQNGPNGAEALGPGERYVKVEWVGEKSLTKHPVVAYKLLRKGQPDGFTDHQAAVVRAASRLRIGRTKGHNRAMGPESGLSRKYLWGPSAGTYVRRMTYKDAQTLKATNSGHEFRILDEEPGEQELVLPDGVVRLVGAREFTRIEVKAALSLAK